MLPFYTPWKHQKTVGFLTHGFLFSEGIEGKSKIDLIWTNFKRNNAYGLSSSVPHRMNAYFVSEPYTKYEEERVSESFFVVCVIWVSALLDFSIHGFIVKISKNLSMTFFRCLLACEKPTPDFL